MSELVIKKRVSLEFLGEEYKDSYVTCSAIPVKDYQRIIERGQKAEDDGSALKLLQDIVSERFIEGKVAQDGGTVEITKSNLNDLPGDVFTEIMQQLTGKLSPNS